MKGQIQWAWYLNNDNSKMGLLVVFASYVVFILLLYVSMFWQCILNELATKHHTHFFTIFPFFIVFILQNCLQLTKEFLL